MKLAWSIILLGQLCIVTGFVSPDHNSLRRSLVSAMYQTVKGPDMETKPDYENIHGPLGKAIDRIFLMVFRARMAEHVGVDSSLPKDDYQGLMELTNALNARYSDRKEVQKTAQNVLRSLFPSWLPGQYAILFSKPFPEFSARMNAWATRVAGTWLMGECEVNDIEIDGNVDILGDIDVSGNINIVGDIDFLVKNHIM